MDPSEEMKKKITSEESAELEKEEGELTDKTAEDATGGILPPWSPYNRPPEP